MDEKTRVALINKGMAIIVEMSRGTHKATRKSQEAELASIKKQLGIKKFGEVAVIHPNSTWSIK